MRRVLLLITSILIMNSWGLDLGQVTQLGGAGTLTPVAVLLNHSPAFHSFKKIN